MTEKTPKSFEELIQVSEVPVFVDFWAEWCGPCRMVAPSVKQLAEELAGRLTVIKINVDEKPEIASQYGIQSIPTFMIFYKGKAVSRFSGAMPYPMLKQEVEKNLLHLNETAIA
ncbi:thioredoxin [bacterium]|nr:thioredoxin [bacterium]